MSRRVWISIALVAAIALAVAAVPALSADSGTTAVSVTAQAPAAPCLTVTPGSVDFGTLPFSPNNTAISQGNVDLDFDFCGTAPGQLLLGSTTPAAGPSGAWTPRNDGGPVQPCPEPDRFYLSIFGRSGSLPPLYLTGTPAPVLGSTGEQAQFSHGVLTVPLKITMPCQGSNGPGEPKTLTATFTAVVP